MCTVAAVEHAHGGRATRLTRVVLPVCRAQVDENVAREIVCHRLMRHRNIVLFKEARRCPTRSDVRCGG